MNAKEMRRLMEQLWPLPRSITGDAVRQSIGILKKYMPIEIMEIPSGTQCFDWTVPKEWSIRDAWVKDASGAKIIDFSKNNLSLVSYSIPFHGSVSREELLSHLHTDPRRPEAIPYRTSYYKEYWGFCIEHQQLKKLTDANYEVFIDAELKDGFLSIAEAVIPGQTDKEILITSYLCHPSMANNELSGPVALAAVCAALQREGQLKHTVRFVLHPETIGSISYLAARHEYLKAKVIAGLSVSMVGNDAPLIYKNSRRNSVGDKVARNIYSRCADGCDVRQYSPIGGADQRQYCSIGINLPIGFMGRAIGGSYAEYHCSLDTIDSISFTRMEQTVEAILAFIHGLDLNDQYINMMPYCEPQLGKRGLYPLMGGKLATREINRIKMILGYGDGEHDLVELAELLNEKVTDLEPTINNLLNAGLLRRPDQT